MNIEEIYAKMLAIKGLKFDTKESNSYENKVRTYCQNQTAIALHIDATGIFYNYGTLQVSTISNKKAHYTLNYDYFLDFVERSIAGEVMELDENKLLIDINTERIYVDREVTKDNPVHIEEIKFLRGLLNSQELIIKK